VNQPPAPCLPAAHPARPGCRGRHAERAGADGGGAELLHRTTPEGQGGRPCRAAGAGGWAEQAGGCGGGGV